MGQERIIAALPGMSREKRARVRENAQKVMAKGDGAQKEAALEVIEALDRLEENEHQELVGRLSGIDVAARVVEAFRVEPMTETEAKIIQALLDHPGSSSSQLSEALGWGGQSWHMHFGTMCFNRATYLWPAPKSEMREADFYSGILADWSPEGQWQMKPEVAAAFAELGLPAGRDAELCRTDASVQEA